MGLDYIELIMEIEEKFRVCLPDSAWDGDEPTVGAIAAMVQEMIDARDESLIDARCFFALRRALMRERGLDKRLVRPSTPLGVAVPFWRRLRLWRRMSDWLESQGYELPPLGFSPWGCGVLGLTLVAIATAATVRGRTDELWGTLIGIVAFAAWAFVAALSRPLYVVVFPGGAETIGDLARLMRPRMEVDVEAAKAGSEQPRADVLSGVIDCISEQIGIPREKIKPESRIYADLGIS